MCLLESYYTTVKLVLIVLLVLSSPRSSSANATTTVADLNQTPLNMRAELPSSPAMVEEEDKEKEDQKGGAVLASLQQQKDSKLFLLNILAKELEPKINKSGAILEVKVSCPR